VSLSPSKSAGTMSGGGPAVGVTAFEGADSGPSPTAFLALTVNVYVVPLVRPVITVWVTFPTSVGVCATAPM
jgi:hypothetical protein